MKIASLLFAILLTGCGMEEASKTAETPSDPAVIAPEFVPYYQRFEADTGHSPWNVSIAIGAVYSETDAVGQCYHSVVSNSWKITVDAKYWAMYDDTARELLVYHELGHCVLNRSHVEDHDSIMRPLLFDTIDAYREDKASLIAELVNG